MTTDRLTFCATVLGPPQFYGNKRAFIVNGKARVVERKGEKVRSWQDTLRAACLAAGPPQPINGPVRVGIMVLFARPAGHFGTGKNVGHLKESAPLHMPSKPDSDKIARCVLDCLTGTWIIDDARVVDLHITKYYVSGGAPAETQVWMEPLGC